MPVCRAEGRQACGGGGGGGLHRLQAVWSLEDGGWQRERAKLIWLKANASSEGFRWQRDFQRFGKVAEGSKNFLVIQDQVKWSQRTPLDQRFSTFFISWHT